MPLKKKLLPMSESDGSIAGDWGNVVEAVAAAEITAPAPKRGASTRRKKEVPSLIKSMAESAPLPPPEPSTGLESVPTMDLLSQIMKEEPKEERERPVTPTKTRAKSPKKKSVNFASPESVTEQANRRSIMAIYNELFSPGVSSLHNCKKKDFPEDVDIAIVEKEIKDIQSSFATSSPTLKLSDIWVSVLGAVETFGAINGTPFPNLGKIGHSVAGTPQAQTTFREILMKYPILRQTLAMGDFPELKLLFMTLSVVEASHSLSKRQVQAQNGSEH